MKPPIRGSRGRIAFLWPADGRNDDEYWNYLPDGVALLTARYPVGGGLTLEELRADADPNVIGAAARLFRHVPVDVAALGDCAGTVACGLNGTLDMVLAVTEELDTRVATVMEAILEALEALYIQRVVLVAPYSAALVQLMVARVESIDVEVLHHLSLGAEREAEIGDRSPDEWAEIARSAYVEGAEAVLLCGGGVRIAAAVEALEASLGVPVIAGPAALIWSACIRMGVDPTGAGPGRLFAKP